MPPYPAEAPPPYAEAAPPYREAPSSYPHMLPPPVPYPSPRRWRLVVAVVAAIALIAGVVVAIGFATRRDQTSGAAVTSESARVAIQSYLDALSNGDDKTVARHTLCGLYDAVKERRSDLALAALASDAFRKQFSRAEVTTIDKVVTWSPNQAQVLFTMRVAPAGGSSRGQQPPSEDEQGIAQLLIQDREVLVCSYLLRSGQF